MRPLLPIAIACAALALPGCGGDNGKPISHGRATQLNALLNEVEQRSTPTPVCNDLQVRDNQGRPGTLIRLTDKVDALPNSVDQDVRNALSDSVAHLRDLIRQECSQQNQPQTTPTETTPTETTPTETTPTETTPTETTPTETTPTNPNDNGGGQPGPGDEGKKNGHKKKGKEARR